MYLFVLTVKAQGMFVIYPYNGTGEIFYGNNMKLIITLINTLFTLFLYLSCSYTSLLDNSCNVSSWYSLPFILNSMSPSWM